MTTHGLLQNMPEPSEFRNFSVDRPGRLIFIGHHLATGTTIRCLVRTVSLHGATLDLAASQDLPPHFFLEILGIRDEIGCTVISREGNVASVGFNMLLDAEFLHHLIRLGFEASA